MKTLLIAFTCFITVNVFSQSITNILGTGGVFTIKDASNNYFTLTQSTGQVNILKTLRLENTTSSSMGIIFKGTDRFIHNYYPGTSYNTFMGINAGDFTLTTANYNTGVGGYSLSGLTTGNYNTALGYASLYSNTTGYQNTALGVHSLYVNTTGSYNTALGYASLFSNYTGSYNTALGYYSLLSNTDGFDNTALGQRSLYRNTTGSYNTALGKMTLYSNTTGFNNTALGDSSGYIITTGNNLTLIGYSAQPTSGSATNQITLGNSSVTSLRCAVTTITSLSDARDKKNIKDLSLGLDFLMKIKPRLFNWDKREWYENNISDGSKMKETPTAGFIAQELDEVQTTENAEWLNLVLKDNPEKFEATSGNLLPVMVKAIQELKEENDKMKVESSKLKVESLQLKNENKEIKQNNEKLSLRLETLNVMNEKIVKLEKLVNEMTSIKQTSLKGKELNLTISK